jgi:hypothetical protein
MKLLIAGLGLLAFAAAVRFMLAHRRTVMSGASRIQWQNKEILSRWKAPEGQAAVHASAPPEETIPPGGRS